MIKSRFVVIGSGWRSLFYIRIAKAFPELLELCALRCRTEEKAHQLAETWGIHTTTSQEECAALQPDFVVVAVNKASLYEVTVEWLNRGFPVLCETPPALETEQLKSLWQMHLAGARLQIAEQYFLYPSHAGRLKLLEKDLMGAPYHVSISQMHDYHGVSMIRKILRTGFQNVQISGKKYTFPVAETLSRTEAFFDGTLRPRDRAMLTLDFEDGKAAFYDFSSVQYHSTIRGRYVQVQGPRGELLADTLRYLDENCQPQQQRLVFRDNDSGGVCEVLAGEESLYREPSEMPALPEDETAMSAFLLGMKDYAAGGPEIYPLAEALQDAYISLLMHEALETPGKIIRSETQCWSGKEY